jgi:thiol-disulfide isomerase/thioredoxin
MRRAAGWAWIALAAFFTVPVLRHVAIHGMGGHQTRTAAAGPLLTGLSSLDSLLASGDGLPAVLNFWATWCSPCVSELPNIDSLGAAFRGELIVVAVDVGDPDPATVGDFLAARPLGIPVVWLDEHEAAAAVDRFGLPGVIPVTVFLDSTGAETMRATGSRSLDWFLAAGGSAAGAGGPDVPDVDGRAEAAIHINVVGPAGDSLTAALLAEALLIAGGAGVDTYDPTDSSDCARAAAIRLPLTGYPYAQPCVGDACGRPIRDPSALAGAVEQLAYP